MWLYLLLAALAWTLGWLVRDRRTLPSVKDKHVFITGCDSGFGNLLARRLARQGYRVLAACLTQKGADSLQRSCSGHLRTTLLDVTCSDSIRRAVEWVRAEVGEKGERGRMGPGEVLGGHDMGSQGRCWGAGWDPGRCWVGGYGIPWEVLGVGWDLRRDMYHFGVKVSIVEPGFFKTAVTNLESIEASLRQLWDRLAPETRLSYG
ncbi:RDH7 dehydrogenase, partial [Sula dactylatra]|nr:RDH7 dehydrogenase [Sula dactylatra]